MINSLEQHISYEVQLQTASVNQGKNKLEFNKNVAVQNTLCTKCKDVIVKAVKKHSNTNGSKKLKSNTSSLPTLGSPTPSTAPGMPVASNHSMLDDVLSISNGESVGSVGPVNAPGGDGDTTSPDALNGAHVWFLLCEISLIAQKKTLTAADKAKITAIYTQLKALQPKIPSSYNHLTDALNKLMPFLAKMDVTDFNNSWQHTDNFASFMLPWLQSYGSNLLSDSNITNAQKSDFTFYSNMILLTVGQLPQYSKDGTMSGYYTNPEIETNLPKYIFTHFMKKEGGNFAAAKADYQSFLGILQDSAVPTNPKSAPYNSMIQQLKSFGGLISHFNQWPNGFVKDPDFFDFLGIERLQEFLGGF